MDASLVDHHATVGTNLRPLLAAQSGVWVHEATTGGEALRMLRMVRPTLIILDLDLVDPIGLDLLRHVLREHQGARVLAVSANITAARVIAVLRTGAAGYLSRSASTTEVSEARRRVADGGRYIEAEIAQVLALQATSRLPSERSI